MPASPTHSSTSATHNQSEKYILANKRNTIQKLREIQYRKEVAKSAANNQAEKNQKRTAYQPILEMQMIQCEKSKFEIKFSQKEGGGQQYQLPSLFNLQQTTKQIYAIKIQERNMSKEN